MSDALSPSRTQSIADNIGAVLGGPQSPERYALVSFVMGVECVDDQFAGRLGLLCLDRRKSDYKNLPHTLYDAALSLVCTIIHNSSYHQVADAYHTLKNMLRMLDPHEPLTMREVIIRHFTACAPAPAPAPAPEQPHA